MNRMPPSAFQEISVEEEYKKNKQISPQDIARLREWLSSQPHLPAQHITDLDLVLTYHCCDHSSSVSKQVLDLNLTLRTHFSTLFKDRSLDDRTRLALNTLLISILPQRSKEGYACFYTHFQDCNAKNFILADAFRAGFMTIDLWQHEEGTWPGLLLVLDLEDMSLAHLACLDIQVIQQFLFFLQEAMLVKVKGLHYINAPPFMDKIMMLIKPFLKKELMDVLHIHQTGSKTLDKFYPLDAIPSDTETRRRMQEYIFQKLESGSDFFTEENKKRVNESKRPGKPKTITDFFGGIEGSFKKLDID